MHFSGRVCHSFRSNEKRTTPTFPFTFPWATPSSFINKWSTRPASPFTLIFLHSNNTLKWCNSVGYVCGVIHNGKVNTQEKLWDSGWLSWRKNSWKIVEEHFHSRNERENKYFGNYEENERREGMDRAVSLLVLQSPRFFFPSFFTFDTRRLICCPLSAFWQASTQLFVHNC